MEYKIVSVYNRMLAYGIRDLEKEVSKLAEEGWQIQGGVAIVKASDFEYTLAQAMIKYPSHPVIKME